MSRASLSHCGSNQDIPPWGVHTEAGVPPDKGILFGYEGAGTPGEGTKEAEIPSPSGVSWEGGILQDLEPVTFSKRYHGDGSEIGGSRGQGSQGKERLGGAQWFVGYWEHCMGHCDGANVSLHDCRKQE